MARAARRPSDDSDYGETETYEAGYQCPGRPRQPLNCMSQTTTENGQTTGAHDGTDPLNAKILEHLGDRVILKPLTRWNEAYKEFPRYVLEYLCARYIAPHDPLPGQKKIDRLLQEHYVESGAKELIKHRIAEKGEYSLLGPLTLVYDQRRLHYWAEVPA